MEVAVRSSRTRTTVPSSGLRLWVQTTCRQWHDSPPDRPTTSSAERVSALPADESRGKAPRPDELHRKPQFVNLVEIISTALAWLESSREELDMRCRGTFAAV
jgi:hypothetical protein